MIEMCVGIHEPGDNGTAFEIYFRETLEIGIMAQIAANGNDSGFMDCHRVNNDIICLRIDTGIMNQRARFHEGVLREYRREDDRSRHQRGLWFSCQCRQTLTPGCLPRQYADPSKR